MSEDGVERFDAVGPLNDDGSFVHYRTSDRFVVSSEEDGEEFIKSDRTMVVVR